MSKLVEFEKDLVQVLVKHSIDAFCNTDAKYLAVYISTVLGALKTAKARE